MALIVEDGTGRATADSYVDVSAADAYHTKFGNAAWAALNNTAKEQALLKATRYIDTRYSFRGERYNYEQALQWPRSGYGSSKVHETSPPWPVPKLPDACCELALLIASDPAFYATENARAITEQTVGPITTKYSDPRFGGQKRYPLIDDLLSALVSGGSNSLSMRMDRA